MRIRLTEDQPFVKLDSGRCFWIRVVKHTHGNGKPTVWRIAAWRREQPKIVHPLSRDFLTPGEATAAMKSDFDVDVASNPEVAAIVDRLITERTAKKLG